MSIALEHFLSVGYAICAAKIIIIFFFAIQISTHTPLESGSCYVAFECNTVMKKATINNRDIREMRYEYVKGVSHSRIVMQANISISHTSVKFEIEWIV